MPAPHLEGVQERSAPLASFQELALEREKAFYFDLKLLSLSTKWAIRGERGRLLMWVKRPVGQAVVSEAVAAAETRVEWGLDGEDGSGVRPSRFSDADVRAEHAMARSYELTTEDGRWLGTVEKAQGHEAAWWTLRMSDGRPLASAHVTAQGDASYRAELFDGEGRVSMTVEGDRRIRVPLKEALASGRRRPMVDAWGRTVAELMGFPAGAKLEMKAEGAYPLYPLFLAVICLYEMDPRN